MVEVMFGWCGGCFGFWVGYGFLIFVGLWILWWCGIRLIYLLWLRGYVGLRLYLVLIFWCVDNVNFRV